MTISKAGKARKLKRQLFDVLLGWLVLVSVVGMFGFMFGVVYAGVGYKLPLEQISTTAGYGGLGMGAVVLFGLAWLQIRQTRQLVSRLSN